MKIMTKLRAAERRSDTARLAAPQMLPFKGDGPSAQWVMRTFDDRRTGRGPNSFLGRTKAGNWASIPLRTPTRADLVAARFEDWLAARDAMTESLVA